MLVKSRVNCLAKVDGLEQALLVSAQFLKEIGWLGGTLALLPDRERIKFQKQVVPDLWEIEDTCDLHLERVCL